MNDLRRLRVDVEHIGWFITSMEYHKTLFKYWIETNSNCSQAVTEIHALEISEDDIQKSMRRYNITEFGQMAAYVTGAKWAIEQLKNK